ncbi:MAG: hypothetical protein EA401_10345 [Planctomycetota bacterium]|nr:MAG: hypothetical protein EA401_10345 [Planctomycetota bacterium]
MVQVQQRVLPPQHPLHDGLPEPQAVSPAVVRDLVAAAQILFDGDLAQLAEDLRRRAAGEPYLFAMDAIEGNDVAEVLERLQQYEATHGVRLAAALEEDIS